MREPKAGPSPDDPSWGIGEAVALLLASILALVASEIGAIGYLVVEARAGAPIPFGPDVQTDPNLTVARILASGAAHLLTFALAWYLVTNGGRDRFFEAIGWGWRPRYTLKSVTIVFALIFVVNTVLTIIFSELKMTPESTPFDELLKQPAARLAIGIFAVVSAPFVEEVVYRGVLYPAIARRSGRIVAIVIVSALFLGVHVDQYGGAVALLVPLGVLSVTLTTLRAYSGSLLPSFVLHLLFNAVQVALIFWTGAQ